MHRSFLTSPTSWLILVNLGAWLFLGLQGAGWIWLAPHQLAAWGGNLGPSTLSGEWPRLLTAMFLHAGVVYLALNVFLLSRIGPLCEAAWGRTRFLLIYLLSGLFGGLASAWWSSQQALRALAGDPLMAFGAAPAIAPTVSVGASGALLGAAGALLVLALYKGKDAQVDLKRVAQVVALNLGMGLVVGGIDNAAHVGGAVAGMAIAALLLAPGERLRLAPRLQSAAVFGAGLLVLGTLALQAPSPQLAGIAQAIRASAADEARSAAQQAKRDRAWHMARIERASLPAPVPLDAAAGKSVTIDGSFAGQAWRPGSDAWYAADASSNRIARMDLAQLQLDRSWSGPRLPRKPEPGCVDNTCRGVGAAGVAGSRDGKWAMASSLVPDAVSRIDLASGKVLWSVKVGRYPRSVFLSDNERYAFAMHGPDNSVSVIDIAQQKLLSSLPVGAPASGLPFGRAIGAAQGKGVLYLADPANHAVYALDTEAPGKPEKIVDTGHLTPTGLALSADGARLFVAGAQGMQIVDTRTRERSDEFASCASDAMASFAANRDGSWIAVDIPYAEQVRIVSVASGRVVRVLPAPGWNKTMGFAADGKSLYTLTERAMEEPSSILTRFDLSRTLDMAAAVEQHGEVFCEPATQVAAAGSPLQHY